MYDVLIIGGGAAGFFTAINCATKNSLLKIAILEKSKEVLSKVRISGGGRCNLTHAEFIPQNLVKNYPRGEKELLSPFHRFMCGDVMEWFESRGVKLKIEDDGRVFPASNSSESVVNCFLKELKLHNIRLFTEQNVTDFYCANNFWEVKTTKEIFSSQKLVITTGSNPKIWKILSSLGHTIIKPVPSLFTFGCFASVAFSYFYLEKTLYLNPCPLCMMQRLAFILVGIMFVLDAALWPQGTVGRVLMKSGKYLSIFFGVGLAARHLYIQSLPADQVPACGLDFAI